MATIPTLTDPDLWKDADLQALRVAVLTEIERRQTLAAYPAQQEAAQARMEAAIAANTAAATPYNAGTTYPMGSAVTAGGKTYWWPGPGTIGNDDPTKPGTHWHEIPNPGTTVEPFDYKTTILVNGNLYSDSAGKTWRYVGATRTAPTNDPNQGPMNNANWQAVS